MSGTRRCSKCDERAVARRLCRRHYQQAWKAGELQQHSPQSTRTRARTICPPEHRHGQVKTCYVIHQCRCQDCRDANRDRERQRRKLIAYGRYDSGLVDVAPVREHVLWLGEQGMGYKRVAQIAGVGTTAVRTILWGRQEAGPRKGELQKRIARWKADAILSVQPTIDNLGAGATVPARGSLRRLQALIAIGWSQSKLADRLGRDPSNFAMTLKRDHVTARFHRDVAALYDELWNQSPPTQSPADKAAYTRTLSYARTHGFLPPLAWDDIDTDESQPADGDEPDDTETWDGIDEIAIEEALAGRPVGLSRDERREAIRRLNRLGRSDSQIASTLGLADRTVWRIRKELGLPAAVGHDGERIAP